MSDPSKCIVTVWSSWNNKGNIFIYHHLVLSFIVFHPLLFLFFKKKGGDKLRFAIDLLFSSSQLDKKVHLSFSGADHCPLYPDSSTAGCTASCVVINISLAWAKMTILQSWLPSTLPPPSYFFLSGCILYSYIFTLPPLLPAVSIHAPKRIEQTNNN